MLCKAIISGQLITVKRDMALSCQLHLMADLQLAVNHSLTTTTTAAAFATSIAAVTNLRLWV